jgi:hypothetical protein
VNIESVQEELRTRLLTVVDDVYVTPPASPVFPCAIISFPEVESFHNDAAHTLTRITLEIEMNAGRGDTDDAFRRLTQWVSTDTPASVLRALEARPKPAAVWQRLTVRSTSGSTVTAESVQTTFIIEIDA